MLSSRELIAAMMLATDKTRKHRYNSFSLQHVYLQIYIQLYSMDRSIDRFV